MVLGVPNDGPDVGGASGECQNVPLKEPQMYVCMFVRRDGERVRDETDGLFLFTFLGNIA